MEKNKAVFLDRDDTIIRDGPYLADPKGVVLFPDTIEALKRLKELDYKLIVITNQSGIGRGYLNEGQLQKIHKRINNILKEGGAGLDAIYYCPHLPDAGCECRKPNTLLYETAIKEYCIDTKKSYSVGDKESDIMAGSRVGCETILVNRNHIEPKKCKPNHICENLIEAANYIESKL